MCALAKKLVVLSTLILALLFAEISMAASPAQRPNFEKLATDLQLDDTQKGQFISIMEQQHEQRRLLRMNSRKSEKVEMESIDLELEQQLSTLLSADQLALFKAKRDKRIREKQRYRAMNARPDGCCGS